VQTKRITPPSVPPPETTTSIQAQLRRAGELLRSERLRYANEGDQASVANIDRAINAVTASEHNLPSPPFLVPTFCPVRELLTNTDIGAGEVLVLVTAVQGAARDVRLQCGLPGITAKAAFDVGGHIALPATQSLSGFERQRVGQQFLKGAMSVQLGNGSARVSLAELETESTLRFTVTVAPMVVTGEVKLRQPITDVTRTRLIEFKVSPLRVIGDWGPISMRATLPPSPQPANAPKPGARQRTAATAVAPTTAKAPSRQAEAGAARAVGPQAGAAAPPARATARQAEAGAARAVAPQAGAGAPPAKAPSRQAGADAAPAIAPQAGADAEPQPGRGRQLKVAKVRILPPSERQGFWPKSVIENYIRIANQTLPLYRVAKQPTEELEGQLRFFEGRLSQLQEESESDAFDLDLYLRNVQAFILAQRTALQRGPGDREMEIKARMNLATEEFQEINEAREEDDE
jgi:hypothetical protein